MSVDTHQPSYFFTPNERRLAAGLSLLMMMSSVFKMMDSALNMMNSALNKMNSVFKMMDSVQRRMNSVFNMKDPGVPSCRGGDGGPIAAGAAAA